MLPAPDISTPQRMDSTVFLVLFAAGCAGILLSFLRARPRALFAQDGFRTPGRRLAAHVLLASVLLLTVAVPFAAGLAGPEPETRTLSHASLFVIHGILAIFLVVYYLLSGRTSIVDFLRLRSSRPAADLSAGVLIGAAGWLLTLLAAAVIVGVWVIARGVPPSGGPATRVSPMIVWLVEQSVWVKLAIVASAMVVEELFFRSFLQTRVGAVAATLMFTAAHGVYGQPLVLAGILVISGVLSVAYALYGNVLPCIVAHGVFDAIQMFIVIPLILRAVPGS